MPKIEKGKQYKTENGLDVEFTHWNRYNVCGVVKDKLSSGEINYKPLTWGLYSGLVDYGRKHLAPDFNLVEVKPRIKREFWVNVYPKFDYFNSYTSKEVADQDAYDNRIACVKVVIDCEEGEGL